MIYQIIITLIAYLIGSVSFGILASKLFNIADPRTMGSKNPGATNVMRQGNKVAAIFTLLGDMLKATILLLIAKFYGVSDSLIVLISIAVMLGHVYPIYYQFKGGKGVATALGILLGISPVLALSVFIIWIIIFFIWKFSSLAAIGATLSSPIIALWIGLSNQLVFLMCILSLIILVRHKSNIKNLLNGTESGFKK
ncbi:MAG: glycerol-3-phosphate 1-O-acyltransferase PlsY [Methylophilaceae bacterium]|jgi:glycerol-3-phosphate acyltransferase PlsY